MVTHHFLEEMTNIPKGDSNSKVKTNDNSMTKKKHPQKKVYDQKTNNSTKNYSNPIKKGLDLADSAQHEAHAVLLLKVQTLMVCIIR